MGVGLHNVWVPPDVHVLVDAAADRQRAAPGYAQG